MIDYYEGGLYVSVPASVEIEAVEEDSAGNAVESQREMIMVDAVVYIWKGTRAELVDAGRKGVGPPGVDSKFYGDWIRS